MQTRFIFFVNSSDMMTAGLGSRDELFVLTGKAGAMFPFPKVNIGELERPAGDDSIGAEGLENSKLNIGFFVSTVSGAEVSNPF